MCSVDFKIFILPDGNEFEDTANYVKLQYEHLKTCAAVENVRLDKFEIATFHEYQKHLNVTGLLVSVQAFCCLEPNAQRAYDHLRNIWSRVAQKCTTSHSPLLVLNGKNAFPKFHIAEHESVHFEYIGFGVLPQPGSFVQYAQILRGINNHVSFYHDKRSLQIHFRTYFSIRSIIQLSVPYKFIRRIFTQYENSSVKLFLDLTQPLIVQETKTVCREPLLSLFIDNVSSTYEQTRRILCCSSKGLNREIIGRANVLLFKFLNKSEATEIISRLHYHRKWMDVCYGNINVTASTCPPQPDIVFPHFSCNYLFAALLHRSFFIAEQYRCSSYCHRNNRYYSEFNEKEPLEKALNDLLFFLDFGKFFYFPHALSELYKYYKSHKEDASFRHYIMPEHSRLIRRVVITPTRYLLYPPEIMFENRVLRNFDSDYALRVSFRDDNMSRLSFNAQYTDEEVFDFAIKNPMLKGLTFGERHYEFLAWSNSQIRDHGVWMYACDSKYHTADNIRQWMGDFSHIHTVPKYMARMGQCFSQTVETVSVPLEKQYITIEDIERGYDPANNKPYCFSDGIGKISEALAKKVRSTLGEDGYISAFQIRYGGNKGMLVVDPTLIHTDIVFRKSMIKFKSSVMTKLEIAKISSPISLKLNRPFITLLDGLGIKPEVFLKMQENMLNMLTEMLLVEEKAADYLQSKCKIQLFKFKEMSGSGLGLTVEPFCRAMLLSLHRRHIEMIKTRANLDVDPQDGRNMFGVLDETGQLQYGEVFVQYTNDITLGKTSKDTTIVKGTVVVTKNPCMHPGDVRKLTAVDIPALHHIIDCIVFPQNGPRPHPNEMAGSDLDGDEYSVVWKKELIFPDRNHHPADYPSHSTDIKYNITVQDMVSFLVEYIKNDQVGVIANAHLSIADKEGIHSSKCIKIAKKFSVAVDFAKNGAKVQLQLDERPEEIPDFMERYHKPNYKSKKPLGKLFRVCKDFEDESETASISYEHVQVDPELIYPGWKIFETEALKSLNKYNRLLYTVFQTYGVTQEVEAFSGAFSQLHYRFQERKDKKEIEEIIIGCLKKLCTSMKKEFMFEFAENNDRFHEKLLQKASAWYMVTYRDPKAEFLSFPWIVSGLLANVRLKLRKTSLQPLYSPILTKLNDDIQTCLNTLRALPNDVKLEVRACRSFFSPEIIEMSLKVMIQWAMDMGIIQDPGYEIERGFMYLSKFVDLFLHVASSVHHSSSSNASHHGISVQEHSAAALCLAFLQFCMKLRFCNKFEVRNFVTFDVYKYRCLSKRAMTTYHSLAIKGTFTALSRDQVVGPDITEMRPEYVDRKDFPMTGILNGMKLKEFARKLERATGCENIQLREIRSSKKIQVIAFGSESSLILLKNIIRKKSELYIILV